MSTSSHKIASKTKNCSFGPQSIEKFLALMATQQTEYSDFSYKANGTFSLVLTVKKNGIQDVALKVLECTDHTDYQILAMEREYSLIKQLPFSDYFISIQKQFFLTEMDENVEQDQSGTSSVARKVYFVQEMEICQGTLAEIIQWYSQKGKDPPTESYKEVLAIQMLDAVNLLQQRQIVHGNITTQNFLVSSSQDYPFILKLYNLSFLSPRKTTNSEDGNKSLNSMNPMNEIQRDRMEQDLVSLGKVFLQLDSIGTHFDQSTNFHSELASPRSATLLGTPQLNQGTLLYKIAYLCLSKSKEKSQSARSMLLFLLQKQERTIKTPLFSVILKSQIDSLRLQIPFKTTILDYLLNQVTRQRKLHNVDRQFNAKGQRKTQFTEDLIKSALKIMLEWKEFSEQYDILGVGISGVVFGVENLKENRKSALKLSLCTNQSDAIRKIGLRRICQAPSIVKFYGHKFFKDTDGNQFVVYELERCKYSLTHHLELQRINGQLSEEQKHILTLQILESISFLHENRVLHRNIKLDSFLIAENGSGQEVLKLGNFSHLAQLQDSSENYILDLQRHGFNLQQKSPRNCIVQRHDKESLLYFAPEKWENPNASTYFTDCFSVGLCIFLLGNYIICSEEQLARKLISLPRGSAASCLDMNTQISTSKGVDKIAKQLLVLLPQQRPYLRSLIKECTEFLKDKKGITKDLVENLFQRQIMLNREGLNELLDKEKSASTECVSLSVNPTEKWIVDSESPLNPIRNLRDLTSLNLNFNKNQVGDLGAQSLLSPLTNLQNLSSLALGLNENQIHQKGALFLLSPLANLLNLTSLTLDLYKNQIGDVGAQSLLSPLANQFNLSSLILNLNYNFIGDQGAQPLLSPLANLFNLSSLILYLDQNYIGVRGDQSLLSPLENLLNLSSISLDLNDNQIGDVGAQYLLTPLANLHNLSNLTLNLRFNKIREIGAQSLLSPVANLLNLSSLALNLHFNNIREIGAQSLLSPLENLLNLSSLILDISHNYIGDKGAQYLLSPLANLLNLSSLALDLNQNQIGDIGAQSLLFPLANLLNLSKFSLKLDYNSIGDIGAYSLLHPLFNLQNHSSLDLQLYRNLQTKRTNHFFEYYQICRVQKFL